MFTFLPSYCPKFLGNNIQSIIIFLYYLYLMLIVLPFHPNGRVTLQRFLILNSMMFLTRTTTVSVTSLPQPNFTHKCLLAQNTTATFIQSLKVVVGTKFPPKACGDLIYSGHASCAIMAHMILLRSSSFNLLSIQQKHMKWLSGGLCGAAIGSIFMCRSHYTVDVVLAAYFSYFLVEFYFNRAEGYLDGGDLGRFIRWMEGSDCNSGVPGGAGWSVIGGGGIFDDEDAVWVRKSLDHIGYKDKDVEDGDITTDTAGSSSDGTPPMTKGKRETKTNGYGSAEGYSENRDIIV